MSVCFNNSFVVIVLGRLFLTGQKSASTHCGNYTTFDFPGTWSALEVAPISFPSRCTMKGIAGFVDLAQ